MAIISIRFSSGRPEKHSWPIYVTLLPIETFSILLQS